MRAAAALLAVIGSGCGAILPRMGVIGQPASRLGSGNAEVGASIGLQYSVPGGQGTATALSSSLIFPQLEGNVRYGVSDLLDVNLHLGPEGCRSGVKVGATIGELDIAALPAVGLGVFQASSSGTSSTYLEVGVGLQLLVSHSSGGHAAFGYEFQYASAANPPSPMLTTTAHTLMLAFGWGFAVGELRIRPELAGMLTAGIKYSGNAFLTGEQGVLLAVMPTVTFVITSPAARAR